MGVKYTLHQPKGSHTKDLVLRVSAIDNGWVIKAGGPPVFVKSESELKDSIEEVLTNFVSDTVEPKKEQKK